MRNSISIFIVLSILLSGCMTKNIPPADFYTISPKIINSKGIVKPQEQTQVIIKLTPIRATRALTATDILYTDSQYSWNSYVYSRWNDTPVKLLQTLFQLSIEDSHLFKAVVPPISVAKSDFLLESNLIDLSHHIYDDGTSTGVIRIRFYLIDNKTRAIIETKEFVSEVSAATKNARGAVVALNKSASNIARDLVIWLAEIN